MKDILNLEKYPLDQPNGQNYRELVEQCRMHLAQDGMFSLNNFMRDDAVVQSVKSLQRDMQVNSFLHARRHNIYFKKHVDNLPVDHPALVEFKTSNRTLCADQLENNLLTDVYSWQPLINFLAEVMNKSALFAMDDPLARLNVMSYSQGMALNWHFDRSEFTTTLLLQQPDSGGIFEHRTDLRSTHDQNYEGVAELLSGNDPNVRQLKLAPGTLNVFKGVNTPHRVTPVCGSKERIIAVFSYYDRPGVIFSEEERSGFYGRSAPIRAS